MSFFNKLFKKQKQQNEFGISDSSSLDEKSFFYKKTENSFTVFIKTDENISEEQIDTIFSIVKDGVNHNEIPSKIRINIMLKTGIMKHMTLALIPEGVEVTF